MNNENLNKSLQEFGGRLESAKKEEDEIAEELRRFRCVFVVMMC